MISSDRLKLGGDLGTRLHNLNTLLQFNGLLHHKNNISECHAYHSPLLTWIMETNSVLKLPVTSLSSSRLNSGGEERGREGRRGERKVEVKGQYTKGRMTNHCFSTRTFVIYILLLSRRTTENLFAVKRWNTWLCSVIESTVNSGNSGVSYVWKTSQSTHSWIFKYLT